MKRYFLQCWILLTLAFTLGKASAVPDGFIWIDVSVKFILDPSDGKVPTATNDANLRECFDIMNRWLASYWRGYRMRLVDLDANLKFKRIGGLGDTTGPSKWYSSDLKNDKVNTNDLFEDDAKARKTLFGWNDSAANIYVNNGPWSRARFASENRGVIITGYTLISSDSSPEFYQTNNYKIASNLLHELGHFFELYHTHQTDDQMDDTAPEPDPELFPYTTAVGRNEALVRDRIAAFAYAGRTYVQLNLAEKKKVDNSANNLMSYYQLYYPASVTDAERFGGTRNLLTELQLDRWGDTGNIGRAAVTSGTTHVVDTNAGLFLQTGSSTSPYKLLSDGIISASSSGNDIVLLRQGTYTATTISKPMTIRATHNGPAIIQKP